MFAKDTCFAFERTRPAFFWSGTQWRADRRASKDSRIGRRRTDSHFPFAPAFVAQALAQSEDQNLPDFNGYYGKGRAGPKVRYPASRTAVGGVNGPDSKGPDSKGPARGRHLKLSV